MEKLLQELPDRIEKLLAGWNVPGLALAVVKDDDVVLAQGFGLRELGKQAPVDEHTLFGIGSITKSFTAAAVALLVNEGKLGWDDPVIEPLPGFRLSDPYVTRALTVRDLLAGRVGLVGGDGLWRETDYSLDEIVRRLRYHRNVEGFRSSLAGMNFSFLIAGRLVEVVAGQSWNDFVQERILAPLGMTASFTRLTEALDTGDVATPHWGLGGPAWAVPWRTNHDAFRSGGAIISSVTDMAQWLRLQLGGGECDGQRLVSADAVQEMHAPQMVISEGWMRDLFNLQANFATYGFGWLVSDYYGQKIVEHGGAILGMNGLVAMIPEMQLGIAILANLHSAHRLLTALKFRVFDAYLGAPERDWSAELWPAQKAEREGYDAYLEHRAAQRVTGTSPAVDLERYTGLYVDEWGMGIEVSVTLEGGKLVVTYGPGSTAIADLEHWHYDTFLATFRGFAIDELMTFVLDSQGQVAQLRIEEFPDHGFRRVPATSPG